MAYLYQGSAFRGNRKKLLLFIILTLSRGLGAQESFSLPDVYLEKDASLWVEVPRGHTSDRALSGGTNPREWLPSPYTVPVVTLLDDMLSRDAHDKPLSAPRIHLIDEQTIWAPFWGYQNRLIVSGRPWGAAYSTGFQGDYRVQLRTSFPGSFPLSGGITADLRGDTQGIVGESFFQIHADMVIAGSSHHLLTGFLDCISGQQLSGFWHSRHHFLRDSWGWVPQTAFTVYGGNPMGRLELPMVYFFPRDRGSLGAGGVFLFDQKASRSEWHPVFRGRLNLYIWTLDLSYGKLPYDLVPFHGDSPLWRFQVRREGECLTTTLAAWFSSPEAWSWRWENNWLTSWGMSTLFVGGGSPDEAPYGGGEQWFFPVMGRSSQKWKLPVKWDIRWTLDGDWTTGISVIMFF